MLKAEIARYKDELSWWISWSKKEIHYERNRWKMLRVSTPLTSVHFWSDTASENEWDWRWWYIWCPCCKRPLDVSVCSDYTYCLELDSSLALTTPRFAYAASLWGGNPGYVLGALVLGVAIRRRGSQHDLVLMHTDELPESSRRLLAHVWTLHKVPYIHADANLFIRQGTRFDGVFTKLHALSLVEYTKVLMLDLDLAIMKNADELFTLPAPAAMQRGSSSKVHGTPIDGRRFFASERVQHGNGAYEWGQQGGINAGVMLLEPNAKIHERALKEVSLQVHPERIPGAGPEQDYLSRFFAPSWTHIGVIYNYQLHQAFYALEHFLAHSMSGHASEDAWCPERIAVDTEDLRIIHFSGELKMWDRDFLGDESDSDFANRLLRNCSPQNARLWIDREGEDWEYQREGVNKDQEGRFYHRDVCLEPAIEAGVKAILGAAKRAAQQWREDLEAIPDLFPGLPALPELLKQLREPEWPAEAYLARGARVLVRCGNHEYPGTVIAIHEDLTYMVKFDEAGSWGIVARSVRLEFLKEL